MKRIYVAVMAAIMIIVPMYSAATIIPFSATLDGSFEVPVRVTPATGSASILFDDVTNDLSWTMTFSGLLAPATAAHFHGPAAVGVNAGVQVPISGIAGLTSGTVSGSAVLTSAQELSLLSELFYINIHTSLYPGGEIRGQVEASAVPEPSTLMLIGSGFAGLIAFGRKLRKA